MKHVVREAEVAVVLGQEVVHIRSVISTPPFTSRLPRNREAPAARPHADVIEHLHGSQMGQGAVAVD